MANVLFRPCVFDIISLSENTSAIISFTLSSIIGPKAANDAAADASVIADETEAPDGNAPGGGGGGGGGGFAAAGGGGFAGVIAGVARADGGIEGAEGLGIDIEAIDIGIDIGIGIYCCII